MFESDAVYNMKRWKEGKSAHATWGLLGLCVNSPLFRLVNYWLILYQSDLFLSFLRNETTRTLKKRAGSTNTRLDTLLRDEREVQNLEDQQGAHFLILAIYYNRVRETDVKSTSPTLSLNRAYIRRI